MSAKKMSLQAQVLENDNSNHALHQTQDVSQGADESLAQEQQYRASAYSVLAALLRGVPSKQTLAQIAEMAHIDVDEDELLLSMSALGLAAQSTSLDAIDDEYHLLFVGLGRGELVPYGSWYLTGFLMEQPLSILRDDLNALGFERDENVVEPEDHVAALCEIMVMLISDSTADSSTQNNVQSNDEQQSIFFEKHIAPWMERFFEDLSKSESAVFYRAVGRLGLAFIAFEKQYLQV